MAPLSMPRQQVRHLLARHAQWGHRFYAAHSW